MGQTDGRGVAIRVEHGLRIATEVGTNRRQEVATEVRGVHIWVIMEKLMWWWFGPKTQLLQKFFFKIPTLSFRARALKISY